MNAIRHTTLMLALAATLALPAVARAADDVSAPAAAPTPEQILAEPMPAMSPGMGMGPGMGMRGGAMGENCRMKKGGMTGGGKPCMTKQRCRSGGEDAITEKRLEMLEKRMDMMQMMLEMMLKQPANNNQ